MSLLSNSGARPKVNLRSTAVKRIMQEAAELADPDEDDFVAGPLESDIFEWHCTLRGVHGSEYEGGLYHLRILLPPSYPMSAPDIILMTPNGRFELGKKTQICIDGLTSFHAGSWQPAWGVRTAILGLRSFWMQTGEALSAIGALDYSKDERRRLAKLSRDWVCPVCGVPNRVLLSPQSSKPPATPAAVARPSEPQVANPGETSTPSSTNVEAEAPTSDLQPVEKTPGPSVPDLHPEPAETDELPVRLAGGTEQLAVEDFAPLELPASSAEAAGGEGSSTTTFASEAADTARRGDNESGPTLRHRSAPALSGITTDNVNQFATAALSRQKEPPSPGFIAPPVERPRPRPTPTVPSPRQSAQTRSRRPLLWLDVAIFVCSSLLFLLIARRVAKPLPGEDVFK